MYRENGFESTIKWFMFIAAGVVAFTHLAMLFTEFTFYGSIGVLVNGLYHLVGAFCPILIIILFVRDMEGREKYSVYALGLLNLLGSVVDFCLLIKYIIETKNTEGLKIWLVFFVVLLIALDVLYTISFMWIELEKVTPFFVLLFSVVIVLFRGCVISGVDSKLQSYAYRSVDKSIFSVWEFMFLIFYLAFVICLFLYFDHESILDNIKNPSSWFSRKSLFGDAGSNTNITNPNAQIYSTSGNGSTPVSPQNYCYPYSSTTDGNASIPNGNMNSASDIQVNYIGLNQNRCPLCGNAIDIEQKKCLICGYIVP